MKRLVWLLVPAVVFVLGAGAALWQSGFLAYIARPLPWTAYGYIALGASLYGLVAIALLSLAVALVVFVRRLFVTYSPA